MRRRFPGATTLPATTPDCLAISARWKPWNVWVGRLTATEWSDLHRRSCENGTGVPFPGNTPTARSETDRMLLIVGSLERFNLLAGSVSGDSQWHPATD